MLPMGSVSYTDAGDAELVTLLVDELHEHVQDV